MKHFHRINFIVLNNVYSGFWSAKLNKITDNWQEIYLNTVLKYSAAKQWSTIRKQVLAIDMCFADRLAAVYLQNLNLLTYFSYHLSAKGHRRMERSSRNQQLDRCDLTGINADGEERVIEYGS